LRERFDAGTGLVALGAVLLLVSLFIDWYDPSGDAWAVFEIADLVLAACAVLALVGIVPRYTTLGRAVPALAFAAFVIVAVQLIDPPPAARRDSLEAGAWLALGASALMALGAAVSAASISITVDVHGRERRRRMAAIDAREREAAAAADTAPPEEDATAADARRTRRRGGGGAPAPFPEPTSGSDARRRGTAPAASGGPAPDDDAATAVPSRLWERSDDSADDLRRARRGPEPAAEPPEAEVDGPPADPDRTQALEPIDRPTDAP
jgi:hypothetical protein